MGILIVCAVVALVFLGALRFMLGALGRILAALVKALAVSVLGALLITLSLSILGAADSIAIGLASFVALFPISLLYFVSRRQPERIPVRQAVPVAAAAPMSPPPAVASKSTSAGQLASRKTRWMMPWAWFAKHRDVERRAREEELLREAWNVVTHEADWAGSRIAVARASCERLANQADAGPLDTQATEWALLVRKRVPELVEACCSELQHSTRSEKRELLEDLVEALEQLGAEADRRRVGRRAMRGKFDILRRYIATRVETDTSRF